MNKYVIAFLSLHEGELKQEIVEAKTALEAGLSYLNWWEESEQPTTLEELYNEAFNGDCHIHILDLNKALKTNWGGTKLQPSVGQFESDSGFH
jgi:hypothetical protein